MADTPDQNKWDFDEYLKNLPPDTSEEEIWNNAFVYAIGKVQHEREQNQLPNQSQPPTQNPLPDPNQPPDPEHQT